VINRRLYDEDTRPAETELKKSPGTGVEDDWKEVATVSVESWKSGCEEKSLGVL
jgi:hypothetical protein